MEPADLHSEEMAAASQERTTLRKLTSETEILESTLILALKQKSIDHRKRILEPLHTAGNKLAKIRFALPNVHHVPDKYEYVLEPMCKIVHKAEKVAFLGRKRK